jgi:hypothetical protein
VTDLKIAFRAPWYERERHNVTVNDARSLRPVLQKYDKTDFAKRLVADPQDSLKFTSDDHWSYAVPVTFPAPGTGRQRFATSRLVTTRLRKLYQPAHDRFYAVVVELFCDAPGLPRAGKHDDVTVKFVLRRRHTSVRGKKAHIQNLARQLMLDLLAQQDPGAVFDDVNPGDSPDVISYKQGRIGDREDIWFAHELARQRFVEDHKDLLHAVTAHTTDQAWLVDSKTGSGRWADLTAQPADTETEQTLPMWRLPRDPCDPDWTRSLWFGVVPTYSAEHWNDPSLPQSDKSVPKLDERAIYEIVCIATQAPAPGHEHCPPKTWESGASEPFRLAAPYDPDGTKNRRVTISAPDLRQLAARAGRAPGPGGLSISTPPGSQFKFDPFGSFPSVSGSLGAGGGVCTFAFELFFLVALFLFLMFLPIIVFAFQLWWLLALRFCFPRLSVAMTALAGFFAGVNVMSGAGAEVADLDQVLGEGMGEKLVAAASGPNPPFPDDPATAQALVAMIDPAGAVTPSPEPELPQVPDPLCENK